MSRLSNRILFTLILTLILGHWGNIHEALAASKVTVINKTGYNLDQVKFVQEKGKVKKLVGQTKLANGRSHIFQVRTPGMYRCYIAFKEKERSLYAKGNAYKMEDKKSYNLTLNKMVFKKGSKDIKSLKKAEFDAIK